MIDEHFCARFHVLGTEVGGGDTRRWEATVIIPLALDAWRARTLEQLERLVARVERDPPPLAEPRLALLRRSREWLVSGGLPEPPEPAA